MTGTLGELIVAALTAEKPIVTMHVQVEPSADLETTLRAINAFLLSEFEIDHATLQLEHSNCATQG